MYSGKAPSSMATIPFEERTRFCRVVTFEKAPFSKKVIKLLFKYLQKYKEKHYFVKCHRLYGNGVFSKFRYPNSSIFTPKKIYARNTPDSICQYKEDGFVSRPPSMFTSKRRPMHGTSCPKSQLKSTCLTAKFESFADHTETGEKGQNVISSSA